MPKACIVQYDDVSIPVGYEIIHKDVSYSEIETKKVKRKSSITKNEHFRNLLSQAYNNKVLLSGSCRIICLEQKKI